MGPGEDVVSGDEGGRGGRDFARGEALCFRVPFPACS
jgi:hypothetical protein